MNAISIVLSMIGGACGETIRVYGRVMDSEDFARTAVIRHRLALPRTESNTYLVSTAIRLKWRRTSVTTLLALIFWSGLHLSLHDGRVLLSPSIAQANEIQYTYDELGRLVQATDTTAGQSVQYAYDAVGNITSQIAVSLSALSVSYFSPQQGPAGSQVAIAGTGFSTTPSSNIVSFNGAAAVVQSATQTQLVVVVPAAATSGPITVQVGTASVTTVGAFAVTSSAGGPTITALFPAVGAAGATVTIGGTNFDPLSSNNSAVFDATLAAVSGSTTTTISTSVPVNAGSGKVQVITPRGVAVSPMDFIVVPSGYSTASIGSTGRLPSDGSSTNILLPTANKISVQLFDASAGDLLTIGVGSLSFTSATLKVYKPDGTLLTSGTVTASGQGVQLPKLLTSGTYAIVVDAGAQTGSISLSIVSPLLAALTLNGAGTPVTLAPPGRRALLSFTGVQGTYANVNLSAVSLSAGTVSVLAPNGAIVDSATFGVGGTNLQPQLPLNGTYSVLVDPTGSVGGTLNVTLTTSTTPTLAVNQNVSINLPNTTPVNVPFDATTGQYLSLVISEGGDGVAGATVIVLKPDGSTLTTGTFTGSTCSGAALGCTGYYGSTLLNLGPMPTGGTYTVVVQQVGSGSGTITLTLSAPVTAALTVGTQSSVTAALAGQAMQLTFTAAAGQYVSLGTSEGSDQIAGASLTILSPDGSVLTSGSFAPIYCGGLGCSGYSGSSVINMGPLSMSGTYTVLVQQSTGGTGTLTFIPSNPVPQLLTVGTPSSVQAALLGQAMQLTFTGNTGQYLALGVSEGADLIAGATITVLNPDGSFLTAGTFSPTYCGSAGCLSGTGYSGSAVVNLGPLSQSGTYTVLIQQTIPSPSGGTIGTGTLTIALSAPVSNALAPGTASNEQATLAGQPMLLSFTGSTGQYFSLGISESTAGGIAGATVEVLNPNGTVLTTGNFTANLCGVPGCIGGSTTGVVNIGPLPANGTYTVLLQQTGAGSGGLTLVLSNPVTTALTVGTPTGPSAPLVGQAMQVTFSGAAGQYFALGISENTDQIAGATVTALNPDGTPLTKGTFTPTYCAGFGCNNYSGTGLLNMGPLLASGTYTVLIQQTSGGNGSLTLTLSNPATGTLTPGTPTIIGASLLGQGIEVTFSGVAGTSVDLHAQENYGSYIANAAITVINPDGTPLAKGTLNATTCSSCDGYAGSTDLYPSVLPQTGSYIMMVQQTAGTTGALTLSGNGIQPTTEFSSNFSTSTPGQTVTYTFVGTAGQNVSVGISNLVITPTAYWTYLNVYNPDGTFLAQVNCGPSPAYPGCALSLRNLPQSGTYTVEVVPPGQETMSFTLGFSEDTGGVLTSSTTPTSLSLSVPGQIGLYGFTATAGQSYALYVGSISTTPANQAVTVTVYNSAGAAVGSASGTTDLTVNLLNLAADTYTALIVPAYGVTATMQVTLAPGLSGTLTNGSAVSETTSVPGQIGYFSFLGTAGQNVALGISNLVVTPTTYWVYMYVYNPDGTYLSQINCGPSPSYPGCQLSLTNLSQSGTYTLEVVPPGQVTMNFTLGFSQDTGGALTPSTTPTNLSLPITGENGLYSFTATTGQSLALYVGSISTTPANQAVTATVYNSAGAVVGSASSTTNLTVNLLSLAADTYTVLIVPAYGVTSTQQVTLSPGLNGTLTNGSAVSEVSSVPGQEGNFTFVGTAGQNVSLGISNLVITPTTYWVYMYVYNPDGTYLAEINCGPSPTYPGCELSLPNLPQSGTYTLYVVPPGQVTMSFTLGFSQDTGGALSPSTTPTNLSLPITGENGLYSFTATAGQSYALYVGSISTTPANQPVTATVYNSAGAVVGSANGTTNLTVNLLSLATDTYKVLVVPAYGVTSTQQVTLAPGLSGTLTNGSAVSETTIVPGQEGNFSFVGTAGENVSLGISNLVITPTTYWVYMYVYNPDGTYLAEINCGPSPTYPGCQLSLRNLPQSGTYTLYVVPPGQVTMSFTLGFSQDTGGALTASTTPTTLSLPTTGENGLYSFTATAGQSYALYVGSINTTPANQAVTATVYNSAGAVVGSASGTTDLTVNLLDLAADTYTALIVPAYGATATMQVTLAPGLSGTLTNGSAVSETASVPGQYGYFSFVGTAGQNVSLGISNLVLTPNSGSWSYLYVYKPDGTYLAQINCGPSPTYPGCELSLTNLPQSGTYTLYVVPPGQVTMSFTLGFSQDTGGALTASTTPTNLSLPITGEDGLYSFTATAGQSYALYVGSISTTPANQPVTATVYNSAGAVVSSASGTTSLVVNLLGLPADTYTALIVPAYGVAATMQVTLAPGMSGALPSDGSSANFATSVPGQDVGYLTFSATAGQSLSVALTNLVLTPSSGSWSYVYVYKPDGTYLTQIICGSSPTYPGCELNLTNLPQSGTYTMIVVPPGPQEMTFTMTLSVDAAATLTLGTPTTVTLGTVGESEVLTFTATASETVALTVSGVTTTPANTLMYVYVYNSAGSQVTGTSMYTGTTLNMANLAADTYQVLIYPEYPATSSMQVEYQ